MLNKYNLKSDVFCKRDSHNLRHMNDIHVEKNYTVATNGAALVIVTKDKEVSITEAPENLANGEKFEKPYHIDTGNVEAICNELKPSKLNKALPILLNAAENSTGDTIRITTTPTLDKTNITSIPQDSETYVDYKNVLKKKKCHKCFFLSNEMIQNLAKLMKNMDTKYIKMQIENNQDNPNIPITYFQILSEKTAQKIAGLFMPINPKYDHLDNNDIDLLAIVEDNNVEDNNKTIHESSHADED